MGWGDLGDDTHHGSFSLEANAMGIAIKSDKRPI
jgi:hypothetical protein